MCNRDCFNCKYEDCIDGDTDDKTLDELDKIEAKLLDLKAKLGRGFSHTKEYKRLKSRRNYWLHRARYVEYSKRYYKANTEVMKARSVAWREAHPERFKEIQRKYDEQLKEKNNE